jgi:hypothetical protein
MQKSRVAKNIIALGIISILFSTAILPIASGINREKDELLNVTCRICMPTGIQTKTTQLSIDRVLKIQSERDEEELFSMLGEYDVIPREGSLSSLRETFQNTIGANPMLIKNFKRLLDDSSRDVFRNVLCFVRLDWTCETTFFVPLFMLGTSPIVGWINFPIWMLFGWLLQPFFERTPLIASLFFISLLNPSTDVIDMCIGGRFEYDVETVGLLGKKTFDNHNRPLMFSLIGFHGYHIIIEHRPEHHEHWWDLYRYDTFIGFTLATVIVPK